MNTFVGNESSLTVGGLSGGLSQPGAEDICVNFILAGDLGGTNTRLALYKAGGARGKREGDGNDASPNAFHHPVVTEEFLNEEYFVVGAEETLLNECGVEVKAVYRSTNHLFVLKLLRPFLKRYFWDRSSPSPWQQQRQQYLRALDKHDPLLVIKIVMCFGVAGPVDPDTNRGTVRTSQRPSYLTGLSGKGIWEECTCCELSHYHDLRSRLYVKVDSCSIINDFVAQGYGCLL